MLRWFRESIRFKPLRPLMQWCRGILLRSCGAVLCGFKWVLTAGKKSPPINWNQLKRIVVIRPDRIGDAVLALPAIAELQAACPQAEICVVCAYKTVPIFESLEGVRLTAVEGDTLGEFLKDKTTLVALKNWKPDAVVALEAKWAPALLAFWLGARIRVGYDWMGMGALFSHAVPYPFAIKKTHQVIVNRHLSEACGLPTNSLPDRAGVKICREALGWVETWLKENAVGFPWIVVHPGSRSAFTRWQPSRYAKVIDVIQTDWPVSVVLLCGPGEETLVSQVTQNIHTKVSVAKGFDLKQTIALLQKAPFFLGNATGTMHIAASICPQIAAIIGGTHPHDCPERWGPWGKGHLLIHKTPLEVTGKSNDRWLGPEGLAYIQPEDVLEAIRPVLDRLGEGQ